MISARMALKIARDAHEGQVRKHGDDYIWHCIAVAHHSIVLGHGEWLVACGLLHDTVEDTDVTLDWLRLLNASPEQLQVLEAVTHTPGEPNEDYLSRIVEAGPGAMAVKLADSAHNYDELPMILALGPAPTNGETRQQTYDRLRAKYQRNIKLLENALEIPVEFRTMFVEDRFGGQ